MRGRNVEFSTGRGDTSRRRTHLDPRWKAVPIGSITRHDVKAWAADLARAGVSPSTVQRIVHLFSASLNAAVDAEVIPSNTAARIKLPKGAQAPERFLTRDEYDAILDQLPTARDQLVANLLVNTGLRWGEMAGLHTARVDLNRGLFRVAEIFSEAAGQIKAYPKGKRLRDVPLTPQLVTAVRAVTLRTTCGVQHSAGICRSGLVVTTGRGAPMRDSNWSPVWREAVERAGVGHVRIHDLRHTYASWLLQAGVPLAEVGQLLGHVSTQTTAKYAHLVALPSAAVVAALAGPKKQALEHGSPD
jgi:integrase